MIDGDPGNPGNPEGGAAAAPVAAPAAFTIDDAFIGSLPDDLKAEPSLAAFKGKGVADVLRSHVNAQRLVGADKVVIPQGKLDTPEAWDALYSRLGRPEKPEGYQFDAVDLPEGMQKPAPEFEQSIKALAHGMGLVPKQATMFHRSVMDWIGQAHKTIEDGKAAALESSEAALKAEWGNKYDGNLDLAKKVLNTYGGKSEEVGTFIEKFGSDPVAVRVLANIGNLIGDGNFVKGSAPAFMNTPEDAHRKALDIATNTQNPLFEAYHKKNHIRHNEAVEEVERLFIVAKGNEPVDKK